MRIKNSLKNITVSILSQIIIVLLGFISRKLFIDNLGTEYLGINGLLTNVLSMLSLVEGGIGTSIIYNLYKPLSEDNKEEVIALVQLYKKLYFILAIVMLILSIVLAPFLGKLINGGTTVPNLTLVYFLFVIKNIISYLNAHKWSLITADQKEYVITRINLVFNVITTVAKVLILIYTKNYILYLVVELLVFSIQNIYNGKVVSSKYPYINTKKKYVVKQDVKQNLITNVKALFLHNIGGYCIFGTDNILISMFINIKTVGLYSNYTMVTSQMSGLISPILNGVGASVGNLIATESKEKRFEVFNVMYLINFWIYAICSVFLYNLLNPFIDWWIGKGFLLDKLTFLAIIVNFYLTGLRSSITIFKTKAGIFDNDKYIPLIESVINLVASVILVKYIGLAGIFIGTTISTISIPLWNQPRLVYKEVFNKSVLEYFKKYIIFALLTIISGIITNEICSLIIISNEFFNLVARGLISIIIPNIIFIVMFFRTKEFKYLFGLIKKIITKKLVE